METESLPGRRFRRIDLIVLGLGLLGDLAAAVESALDDLQEFAAQHANYLIDRETFHEQAALELEALTRREE